MRLIKMLGLAAAAAVAAMALVGASSASAANTQLCNSHTALTCGAGQGATKIAVENIGVGTLLTDLVNVLCLTIKGMGNPLGLANPQSIHFTDLEFEKCGTTSAHNNCTVTVLTQPLFNLNKTGLDAGTLTGTNGSALVECKNIDIFGIDIHCVYDFTGLQFSVGAQHLTASNTQIDKISGELCSEESFLDVLLVMVDPDLDPEDIDNEDEDEDAGDSANRYVLA